MYANLIFEVFLNEASNEIELPSPVSKNVQSGRQKKLHLNELGGTFITYMFMEHNILNKSGIFF